MLAIIERNQIGAVETMYYHRRTTLRMVCDKHNKCSIQVGQDVKFSHAVFVLQSDINNCAGRLSFVIEFVNADSDMNLSKLMIRSTEWKFPRDAQIRFTQTVINCLVCVRLTTCASYQRQTCWKMHSFLRYHRRPFEVTIF